MSNIIKEFESRIMLKEEEYLEIVSFYMREYPNQKFIQNTNVYFDSEDLYLRQKHITLRVRIINDVRSELTCKIKGNNGDQEINDDLTKNEMEQLINENVFPDGNVKKHLLTLTHPLSSYKPIATLYNRRLEIAFNDHLLVIDKNTYGQVTDYNLEIETNDDIATANQKLAGYIKKFNLSLQKQKYMGKATRAILEAVNKA
jgi:uncharacterized protein YjbK